ncbi:MAG TPA: YdeI/OmpD-associated family protein, partial [Hyphomicrobiaceae bacterium]
MAVPKEIAQTFSSKRPPVLAHVNGVEYRSRLMVYGGQSYLGLRKDLLRQLDVTVGEVVQVELIEDHQERVVVEPQELTQALADNPAAKAAYERLPFTHRNEYARW